MARAWSAIAENVWKDEACKRNKESLKHTKASPNEQMNIAIRQMERKARCEKSTNEP